MHDYCSSCLFTVQQRGKIKDCPADLSI
ncbi:hypothetical protein [Kosakonia sp. H7A]